ncbi:unnamed protein product [Pleuronectes platessa]|uniref:Uncharacterized protein n=1 Tax=Pleuronectes platessa TaxID=8262 RepID=A0A9N7VM44_PLEPL|nr:unnamed protein product [Pleuronectes platessa]
MNSSQLGACPAVGLPGSRRRYLLTTEHKPHLSDSRRMTRRADLSAMHLWSSISLRVTRSPDASKIGSCGERRRESIIITITIIFISSRSPGSPSGRSPTQTAPLPLDMKVQQGCNSADMGIPVTTEEELRRNTVITPDDVLGLQKITKSTCGCEVTGGQRCDLPIIAPHRRSSQVDEGKQQDGLIELACYQKERC